MICINGAEFHGNFLDGEIERNVLEIFVKIFLMGVVFVIMVIFLKEILNMEWKKEKEYLKEMTKLNLMLCGVGWRLT